MTNIESKFVIPAHGELCVCGVRCHVGVRRLDDTISREPVEAIRSNTVKYESPYLTTILIKW